MDGAESDGYAWTLPFGVSVRRLRRVAGQNLGRETLIEKEMVEITTGACIQCGKRGTVLAPRKAWEAWYGLGVVEGPRPFIQDAFPMLSAGEREQILTGTHPKCWDEMFEEDDAEERWEGMTE
jgi:hypothetical protein